MKQNELEKDIQFVKGVGEKRAALFHKLGIFNVGDLLQYYPRAYLDKSDLKTAAQAEDGEKCALRCTMISAVTEHRIRRGLTLYKCSFSDGETVIRVTIFNNVYLAKALRIYEEYLLYGKIEKNLTWAAMSSPMIEPFAAADAITPVYAATERLSSKTIERIVKTALKEVQFTETLSEQLLVRFALAGKNFAMHEIHFPAGRKNLEEARRRLIFEELLVLNLGLGRMKGQKKSKTPVQIQTDYTGDFLKLLPFQLTNAQSAAIQDCVKDMQSGFCMNRLIEGDVGSGKTAVAEAVIYTAVRNGYQCALMAPTEILAAQHYASVGPVLGKAGVHTELLTGSTPAAEKRAIKARLASGETDLVIGTHAILQADVAFHDPGLVITDEQHRFGVEQRAMLSQKGSRLHTLVMSATPIPRTLALTIFGDLDISVLDEMPPGRVPVRTDVVTSAYHARIYKFIQQACRRGEQAYIVCPLVDEATQEEAGLKSATAYANELAAGPLAGLQVGLLHGKMKAKDKEKAMLDFAEGRTQVLVATTVIEVGVDVPAATIMLIENAERFGLSALHQLRGRVGRGKLQSYCILVSDAKGEAAKNRLHAMKTYTSGFQIAEVDLKMRGPGDFFGKRQNGLPQMMIADMAGDTETLLASKQAAEEILKNDFALQLPQNQMLKQAIDKMFQTKFVAN